MDAKRLALLTEWNFSQGTIRSYDDLIRWSIYLAHTLDSGNSSDRGPRALRERRLQRGAAEILRDLHPVWKKLSYGGRTADDLSPERRAYLQRTLNEIAA